jgi:hypothetical protein
MEGSTVTSSVLNLINNIVGAGLFSMPWCLKEATVATGTVVVRSVSYKKRELHNVRQFRVAVIAQG